MLLSPGRLVDVIHSRTKDASHEVLVFWYQVSETHDRDEYASQVLQCELEVAIQPIVLRSRGFDSANALLTDLRVLLDQNRDTLLGAFGTGARRPFVILLLSRECLGIPQVSSPLVFPEWFPVLGGQSVQLRIEDLTKTADGSLNAPEVQLEQLRDQLWRLDLALSRRLLNARQVDHNLVAGLWDFLRRDGDNAFPEFLEASIKTLEGIRNTEAYRPSVRDGLSMLPRIAGVVSATSPDDLGKKAKALSRALGFAETPPGLDDCLPAVLFRPTSVEKVPSARFGRTALLTIYLGFQLATAGAHADEYPRYPLALLESLSRDLRSVLETLITTVSMPLTE